MEKIVTYTATNSYSTLNLLTEKTRTIWIVLHGIGYLSRYFLRYFDELPPEENYIIAPQAPSKYYLDSNYRHVGASWLTKEETRPETINVIAYLDAVILKEKIPGKLELIVFGFSQGVSIATRWVARKKIKCSQLIMYAGGIPDELEPSDFEFLVNHKTTVKVFVGDEDQYLTSDRRITESKKVEKLFGSRTEQIVFKGGHEVKKELINALPK